MTVAWYAEQCVVELAYTNTHHEGPLRVLLLTPLNDHVSFLHPLINPIRSFCEGTLPAVCEAAWTLLGACTCKMNDISINHIVHVLKNAKQAQFVD